MTEFNCLNSFDKEKIMNLILIEIGIDRECGHGSSVELQLIEEKLIVVLLFRRRRG